MRTLRLGSVGEDVRLWEYFLHGQGLFRGEIDAEFTEETKEATRSFQIKHGLKGDGYAGPMTLGTALQHGYGGLSDDSNGTDGPNWPMHPSGLPIMNESQKRAAFGAISFEPAPTAENPEAVKILDGWYGKNITAVEVKQLRGVVGTSGRTSFEFNKAAGAQFAGLFAAWEAAGLIHLVKSWGGSYAARFIRGSRTVLSNHCYGSAFDINSPWNPLGSTPPMRGKEGSVRELVGTANRFGFYWGGHFSRLDGMHFEVARVVTKEEVERLLGSVT